MKYLIRITRELDKESSMYFYIICIIDTLLQTQDLRVDQEKEPCIRINIRELDRELCTEFVYLIY